MSLSGIIGKKIYQAAGFLEDGTRVPLTAVVTKGNHIVQIKTKDKEGYNSVQLGFDNKKKPSKREVNHIKKAGVNYAPRFFKELRVSDLEGLELGKEVLVADVLKPGDIIDVTGISKGKGYAGVVKRYHFKGGPRTHGQSDRERAPGSIGQSTTPGRVYKGKKMAGRMGNQTSTIKNLEVIEIAEDGTLLIKGLVPGGVNSIVVIKKRGENKKFVSLFKEVKEEEIKEEKEDVKEEIKTEEVAEIPPVEEQKEEVKEEVKEEPKEEIKSEVEEKPIEKKIEEVKENVS